MIAGTLNEIISVYRPSVVEGKYGPKKTVYVPYIRKTKARVNWNNGARTIYSCFGFSDIRNINGLFRSIFSLYNRWSINRYYFI